MLVWHYCRRQVHRWKMSSDLLKLYDVWISLLSKTFSQQITFLVHYKIDNKYLVWVKKVTDTLFSWYAEQLVCQVQCTVYTVCLLLIQLHWVCWSRDVESPRNSYLRQGGIFSTPAFIATPATTTELLRWGHWRIRTMFKYWIVFSGTSAGSQSYAIFRGGGVEVGWLVQCQ